MRRSRAIYLALIGAVIFLSYSPVREDNFILASQQIVGDGPSRRIEKDSVRDDSRSSFLDYTRKIVRDALLLVERNEREGAPLDQRWYAFRRFGEHREEIITASEVRFYGGREVDVLRAIASQYASVTPIEPNQDSGEIRLFLARRDARNLDLIIIGQNGREVALKTVIRLAYLFKFTNDKSKPASIEGLDAFLSKVKIYLSPVSPREEFIAFFHQHQIIDPDAVIIGFQRDSRAVLNESGMGEPQRYSNDSLRVNWYPNAHGRKVLLVSINGNRIFASRAGELIRAVLENFRSPPESLIFFGSAGAIDSPDLVGQIVAPAVVINENFRTPARRGKQLAHIIHNRAATILPLKTAHVSVESVAMETMRWARKNKNNRISTVDQELYHVINAFNASPYANKIRLFVSLLVTDNVSAIQAHHEDTLKLAEDVIGSTTATRRLFLAKLFAQAGITCPLKLGAQTQGQYCYK